jgi:rhodanese-related sulfurtransferase
MTSTLSDLLREARAAVPEVGAPEAELLAARGAQLIDVRERSEWEEGHIDGATHVSRSYLEQQIEGVAPDRGATIVLYCAGGTRSLFAAQTLQAMGYADVRSMSGGFQGWKSSGRSWTAPVVLSREQKQRYSRHLLVPEVGAEGQARLLGSKVLFIGAGGLGAPGLLYLAAAGDHRHRRLRRGRCLEPPAPGDPHHRPGRPQEDRLGRGVHPSPQPGRDRGAPRGDAHRGQRRPAHRGL